MKYGCEGYAIYWYCLELIAGDLGEKDNINFDLKHDAEVIGFNLKIDQLKAQEIMSYMVSISLFEESEGVISCIKLAKYLDKKSTRSEYIHKIIDASKEAQFVPDKDGQSETNPPREDKIRLDKNKPKEKNKKENKKENPVEELSQEVSMQVFNDFVALRKKKKALLTKTAIDGIKREAQKAGVSLETALKECCERGWVGFKAEWYQNSSNGNGKTEKFDPVAYVNRNRIRGDDESDRVISTQEQH